jgi:hypothetical protein
MLLISGSSCALFASGSKLIDLFEEKSLCQFSGLFFVKDTKLFNEFLGLAL